MVGRLRGVLERVLPRRDAKLQGLILTTYRVDIVRSLGPCLAVKFTHHYYVILKFNLKLLIGLRGSHIEVWLTSCLSRSGRTSGSPQDALALDLAVDEYWPVCSSGPCDYESFG